MIASTLNLYLQGCFIFEKLLVGAFDVLLEGAAFLFEVGILSAQLLVVDRIQIESDLLRHFRVDKFAFLCGLLRGSTRSGCLLWVAGRFLVLQIELQVAPHFCQLEIVQSMQLKENLVEVVAVDGEQRTLQDGHVLRVVRIVMLLRRALADRNAPEWAAIPPSVAALIQVLLQLAPLHSSVTVSTQLLKIGTATLMCIPVGLHDLLPTMLALARFVGTLRLVGCQLCAQESLAAVAGTHNDLVLAL